MANSTIPLETQLLADRGQDPIAERAAWVVWSQIPGVGPILLGRLQQQWGSLAAAWQASDRDLATVEGVGPTTLKAIQMARSQIQPNQALAQHERANPLFWTPADLGYPRLLREIADPPAILYYRGQPWQGELDGTMPLIAMVGTRQATDYGRRWAWSLATALTQRGWLVVSGLAEGIDAVCHQAVIAAGGRTIAVLGTGVDRVYPSSNRGLYQQIIGPAAQTQPGNRPFLNDLPAESLPKPGGFALSEYPAGTPPDRQHFPRRNRIVAALGRATIVIEGSAKSGAMITARQATDYGREVYVLPGSLDNPEAAGCLQLISQGATMILGIEELLAALDELPGLDRSQFSPLPDRSTLEVPSDPAGSNLGSSDGDRGRKSADRPRPSAPPIALPPIALPEPRAKRPEPTAPAHLSAVFAAIATEPTSFDQIINQVNRSTADISSALIELELLGLVAQLPGMHYQRPSP